MTPIEKATELVEKYMPYMYCFMGSGMLSNTYDEGVARRFAERSALIVVDEILKSFDSFMDSRKNFRHELEIDAERYWLSVRAEIEKM